MDWNIYKTSTYNRNLRVSATMRNLLSGWPWFHHFFAELDPNFCKVDCLGLVNVKFKFPLHFAVASCATTTLHTVHSGQKNMGEISLFCCIMFCYVLFCRCFWIYWLEIEKSQYSPHLCMSTDYKGSEPDVLVHILKVSEISYLFVFRWFQTSELMIFYYQRH